MATKRALRSAIFGISLLAFDCEALADQLGRIPDEFETTSGIGSATNNAGAAATDSFSAITINPALLTGQKSYVVHGVYHWPTQGRDYYQGGIVDSKLSQVAAGISYTGFLDDFRYPIDKSGKATAASTSDSPVSRRISFGLAQDFGETSIGIGGTYVDAKPVFGSEGYLRGDPKQAGFGLNLGAVTGLAPGWSIGASAQNLAARRISDFAPRIIRVGTAYQVNQLFTAHLELRQRDRILVFEAPLDLDIAPMPKELSAPERMVLASGTLQVQEYLKIMASYGTSIADNRRALAAGVALTNKNFSLSYSASRPYLSAATAHQALMLSVEMAM